MFSNDFNQLLKQVFENIPDQIFIKDRNHRIIACNQATASTWNKSSPEELIGKCDHDHFEKETADKFRAIEDKVMEDLEEMINVEENYPLADGTKCCSLSTKVPLRDINGEVIGLIGVNRNITEQKQTQEKLENVILELRDTQNELVEAEKLKIVGRLAAGVAHEVKNPLNIILMAADTLCEDEIDDAERKELCLEIRNAVLKANDVVFELLDFSSAQGLKLHPASLNKVVQKAIMLVQHRASKSKIVLETHFKEDLPDIPLDEQKLEQVLINLIFNSINASPEGGIIELHTALEKIGMEADIEKGPLIERFRIGDKVATLTVRDNGSGIEEKNLNKVFEPFFTTGAQGKSSGLGLMVTKNIIEKHHGVLTLKNRVNGGLEAKIYLHLENNPLTNL
jgi:PAS domain S-box-containing protein